MFNTPKNTAQSRCFYKLHTDQNRKTLNNSVKMLNNVTTKKKIEAFVVRA